MMTGDVRSAAVSRFSLVTPASISSSEVDFSSGADAPNVITEAACWHDDEAEALRYASDE